MHGSQASYFIVTVKKHNGQDSKSPSAVFKIFSYHWCLSLIWLCSKMFTKGRCDCLSGLQEHSGRSSCLGQHWDHLYHTQWTFQVIDNQWIRSKCKNRMSKPLSFTAVTKLGCWCSSLVEHWAFTPSLMQARFPGATRDFSPRANFQCWLSYLCLHTPMCNHMHEHLGAH